MAHNPNRSETKSTHACFTKRAKCMTLSVLETSLPMQRSHDTLAFGIWTKNWCLGVDRKGAWLSGHMIPRKFTRYETKMSKYNIREAEKLVRMAEYRERNYMDQSPMNNEQIQKLPSRAYRACLPQYTPLNHLNPGVRRVVYHWFFILTESRAQSQRNVIDESLENLANDSRVEHTEPVSLNIRYTTQSSQPSVCGVVHHWFFILTESRAQSQRNVIDESLENLANDSRVVTSLVTTLVVSWW